MRIDLSLHQLDIVVRIAEAGSIRAAARQMEVSQPALSRTLRLAEEALGTRLFDRDTRHVAITPAGQELLQIARRVLRDFDNALGELGQFMQGHRGRISMAALPSVSAALLPAPIAAFRRQYPQVEFTLREMAADALLDAVEQGQVDFGLGTRPAPQRPLKYRHLRDDPMVLLCHKDDPLALRESLPWSVFAGRDYLAVAPGSSIRQTVDAVFLRKRLAVSPAFEAPSVASCCALARAALGVAALPKLALGMVDMQGLAAVPLAQPAVSRPIGIVTRAGRSLGPASLGLMALLAQ